MLTPFRLVVPPSPRQPTARMLLHQAVVVLAMCISTSGKGEPQELSDNSFVCRKHYLVKHFLNFLSVINKKQLVMLGLCKCAECVPRTVAAAGCVSGGGWVSVAGIAGDDYCR